jgi:DNA-directed RNA polymerase specialized sigma24 family protein
MKLTGRKRSSFEVFAAAHSAGLIKLGLMVSGDRGRAEDAAQEALVRVYQRWSRLDDPLAYARRIVVNATRDEFDALARLRKILGAELLTTSERETCS